MISLEQNTVVCFNRCGSYNSRIVLKMVSNLWGKIWLFQDPVSLILWKENWNCRLLGCLWIEISTVLSPISRKIKFIIFSISVLQYNMGQKKQLWCSHSQECMFKCHSCKKAGRQWFAWCALISTHTIVVWEVMYAVCFKLFPSSFPISSTHALHIQKFAQAGQTKGWREDMAWHIIALLMKWRFRKNLETNKPLPPVWLLGLLFSSATFKATEAHVWRAVQRAPLGDWGTVVFTRNLGTTWEGMLATEKLIMSLEDGKHQLGQAATSNGTSWIKEGNRQSYSVWIWSNEN